MSINQKSGRKTFRRRFVSGSVFSFRLARRNVISKRNENWNLSSLVGVRLDVIQRSDVKVHYGFPGNRLPSTTKLWVLFMKTGFSSVNYNNVYGRWIITQYLRQIKENSKLNNGGFNKWLEILAGKELQIKFRKTDNVDFKFRASNGTANVNAVN